jgi:hypothetical protein
MAFLVDQRSVKRVVTRNAQENHAASSPAFAGVSWFRSIAHKVAEVNQAQGRACGRSSESLIFRSRTLSVRAAAVGGTSTWSHGAAPAQECRLRLKRLPPIPRTQDGSLHLDPRPPLTRGSCASSLFCAVANGNDQVSVLEQKIALFAHFFLQTGIQRIPGGREGENGHRPIPCLRDDGRLINKTNRITFYIFYD